MAPPQDMPDAKKRMVGPAARWLQRWASNASKRTSSGRLTVRPVAPERITRSGASISVAIDTRLRIAVLLAGLISERTENSRSGLPLVDQLGEFGKLFGSNNKVAQRTELIIFIRPQIIRDGVDAMRVAEELRTKLRGRIGTTDPNYRVR